jgi:uncharacterized protein (DUF1800 family)
MKRIAVLVIALSATLVGAPASDDTLRLAGRDALSGQAQAITHVLNRIGYGPRPGDVERVRAMGLQRYIDQQLHPERIPDHAAEQKLAALTTVGLSSREIADRFERPALELRRQKKQGDAQQMSPEERAIRQQAGSVMLELGEQKVLRAVYSERQLQEVLTDFWFNHFNVDARKGRDRFFLTEYERETIRPRVLGKFRDLLEATAKSPAMLFYLDNWMSAAAGTEVAGGDGGRRRGRRFPAGTEVAARPLDQGKRAPRGLNENYGRELMELHTLGVDGGYTQKDVTEVARAFTGWTIENPRLGGAFKFNPRFHDPGQKVVLGHVIKAGGGESDGEQVLDVLAKQPATAHFIATKLARRFVSDTPPPALVDRAAARFRATDGDLREVMRTILTSPEFLAPEAYRAKVKTPFEFVISAARAVGADVQEALPLVRQLQQLGMPLYQCQPPTGYKDTAEAWVNTGALVSRMNFALTLAGNKLRGIVVASLPTADQILSGDLSETTRATIAKAADAPQVAALTLGAPEFQRR